MLIILQFHFADGKYKYKTINHSRKMKNYMKNRCDVKKSLSKYSLNSHKWENIERSSIQWSSKKKLEIN